MLSSAFKLDAIIVHFVHYGKLEGIWISLTNPLIESILLCIYSSVDTKYAKNSAFF